VNCVSRSLTGKARGEKWSDYDEGKHVLHVQPSIWRKHESGPKTEESIAPVHVPEVLPDILAEAVRASEYIVPTPSGRPVDMHNLAARVIVPAWERDPAMPKWRGFYALRRGISTGITAVDTALAAKLHLRHSNLATTMAHYVKPVPADAVRAVDKVSELFDNRGSGRPN
jgi:integrase